MRRLSDLLSGLALILLIVLALLNPTSLALSDEPDFPPWSRPVWSPLGKEMGTTLTLHLNQEGSIPFSWSWRPPLRVALTGTLEPGGRVALLTPENSFTLAQADSHPQTLDLDARDIPFKRHLGFEPFDNLPSHLFATRGNYVVALEGRGNVTLGLEGGRHGLLGTDQRGRDVAALFLGGVRVSLIVGLSATLIATLLGLSIGLLSGYAGGWLDALLMRLVDILLSIPTLPILIVLAGMWGHSLWNLVLVLSLFSWMGTARTVRAMTLSVRDAPWVEGLRALGARRSYILVRHLVPEALPLLLSTIVLGVPGAILSEAGVAFLGLSDPLLPSWGRMLHEAHTFGAFTQGAWWVILPPGLGIALICLIFMNLGRRLEERADPRLFLIPGVPKKDPEALKKLKETEGQP